jgi:thiol:disulfide interchange protein DsbD
MKSFGVSGFLAALALCLLAPMQIAAEPLRTPHVEMELHSTRAAVAPGETFTILLRQKMIPNWHVYWVNPGDNGYATTLQWNAPKGVRFSSLKHPAPQVYRLGPIVNYVHYGEIYYPIAVTLPDDLPTKGALTVSALGDWLICEEECIPEQGTLGVAIPLAPQGRNDPVWMAKARDVEANLPRALPDNAITAQSAGDQLRISIAHDKAGELGAYFATRGVRNAQFFPYSQKLIDHAAEQNVALSARALTFEAPKSKQYTSAEQTGGVISAEVLSDSGWRKASFSVGAPIEPAPAPVVAGPQSRASSDGALTLWAALAFGVLGGLILNVMPCVFPVLSLKALSFATTPAQDARAQGLWFFAGVMATFLALAGVLIALQSAGAAVGWGFQLQEPLVVSALALLFFLIGLNLLGLFEMGGAQDLGSGLAAKSGTLGAFFTGALAVIAASPCTAPFMGAAMGWAATQPASASLAVFAALGAGFAAPFTALAFAPSLQKMLPKPGAWMDRFKQFMAFPMFGAAIWLAWVLTVQAGANGALALLSIALAVAFGLWAMRGGVIAKMLAAIILTGVAVAAWRPLTTPAAPANIEQSTVWSPSRLAALRADGKAVFVNFTAAWCVSCKANEAIALKRPAVEAAMRERDVVYLVADWTSRDGVIAAALSEHGRSGVPLYLYYPAGAANPVVLPQLLTEQIVIDAINAPQERVTP